MRSELNRIIEVDGGTWMVDGNLSEDEAFSRLVADGYQGERESVQFSKVTASRYSRVNPGGLVWKAFRVA